MPSLFTTIRNIFRVRTSGPNPALVDANRYWYFQNKSYSGHTIDSDTALALTAVYRAVVLISTTAASMPIDLYVKRQTPEGPIAENIEPSAFRFLWDRPNPEMTRQQFWETVIGHEVQGNAFIFVVNNLNGAPLELWPIEPERVRIGRAKDQNGRTRKVYEVDNEIPMIDYIAGGEIIHVPNWGKDGLRGLSPIAAAPISISLGLSAQEYADRFFGANSTPDGLISTDKDLTPEQSAQLSELWRQQNEGLERSHRTSVLGSGAKFTQISVSPEDAQLIDERRFQVSEIARLYGVPPHMLADPTPSTSWGAGLEEQTLGFLTYTLQSHVNRFEQAIDDAILRKGDTGRYMKFNNDALLRGTTLRRYQAYAIGYGRWLSTNDIRRKEDMAPVDGGENVLAAQNLIPLDKLEEMAEQEPEPAEVGDQPAAPAPTGGPTRNGNGSRP